MRIIGCDLHSRYQLIATLDTAAGEFVDRRLNHANIEVRGFLCCSAQAGAGGDRSHGATQWFERLLAELGHELWVGHPAAIRASDERQQKTDVRDARLLLKLLVEERFPRIWVPSPAERDTRQLLCHRHKLVQMRSHVKHQLQALVMSQGVCLGSGLWSRAGRAQLEALTLDPWARRRCTDLLKMLEQLDPVIAELTQQLELEAARRPVAVRLMSQPGVGPVTALAFVLTLGTVERFRRSKQVVSYLGLNPRESIIDRLIGRCLPTTRGVRSRNHGLKSKIEEMVGGGFFHRVIQKASLGRAEQKILFRIQVVVGDFNGDGNLDLRRWTSTRTRFLWCSATATGHFRAMWNFRRVRRTVGHFATSCPQ